MRLLISLVAVCLFCVELDALGNEDIGVLRSSGNCVNCQLDGVEIEKEKIERPPENKVCLRCSKVNSSLDTYCGQCSLSLDEKEAMKIIAEDEKRKKAEKMMEKLLMEPEVVKILKKKMKLIS